MGPDKDEARPTRETGQEPSGDQALSSTSLYLPRDHGAFYCGDCRRQWDSYWFQSTSCVRCGAPGDRYDDRPLFLRQFFPLPEEVPQFWLDHFPLPEDDRPEVYRRFFPLPSERPAASPKPDDGQPMAPQLLQARLDGILRRLRDATKGERNTVLHWCACRVGELLASGDLTDAGRAAASLERVALSTGLEPGEVTATIRSGFGKSGVKV